MLAINETPDVPPSADQTVSTNVTAITATTTSHKTRTTTQGAASIIHQSGGSNKPPAAAVAQPAECSTSAAPIAQTPTMTCKCGGSIDQETCKPFLKCDSCTRVTCNIDKCRRTFVNQSCFKGHRYRSHADYYDNTFKKAVGIPSGILSHHGCPGTSSCQSCGEPKNRDPNLKIMPCPKCKKHWCTYDEFCPFEGPFEGAVRTHQEKVHSRDQRKKCGGKCGERKIRGKDYLSQCTKCSRFWCLLGQCTFEHNSVEFVKAHLTMQHVC